MLPPSLRAALAATLALQCGVGGAQVANPAGVITTRVQPVAVQYRAYGRVRPIAVLPVIAAQAGVITELRVFPGSPVTAGERLAALTGPEIESLLVSRQGALRSASSRLTASRRALEIERRQLAAHLATRLEVGTAEIALAAARSAFETARAQLEDAQAKRTLRAPAAGRVLGLEAADGERVGAGQTIVTLQTGGHLWLMASFYGADAASVRVGMSGVFQPAAGGAPIPIKVAAVGASIGADGGEQVGLVAMRAGAWRNGEWGAVTVEGVTRRMIPVPTEALILDQARWWVLVHTRHGDRAQAVVPGPTRGWQTFIEDGLAPGQQVIVQNAYLEYHRGIAARYTPPD
ncbi:MAG: efflux RND transporter periplasmic adaptor subunit [Steroidobacteraceae bacterium]